MKRTFTYLLTISVFLLISAAAMAQDGLTPYAGSLHTYSVTPDPDSSNKTYLWEISGGGTINGATDGSSINVTWGNTPGTYTITFTETDESTSCSTQRTLDVEVIANTFFLAMAEDAEECHDSTGAVLSAAASGPTTVYFTVELNKDSDWDIDSWQYDFTVNFSGSDYSLQSVSVDGGSDLGTSGSYAGQTVSGTSSTSEIAVELSGPVASGTDVTFTISNGVALSGTTSTPDNGTGDSDQVLTINPLPNTSEITTD